MPQYVGVPIYDHATDTIWTLAEHKRVLYHIYLKDDMICPPLLDFPVMPEGLSAEEVHMSPGVKKLFKGTTRLDCGADAIIRVLDEDPTVVLKYALPTPLARARLGNEFALLRYMQHLPLPVPHIKRNAIVDEEGVNLAFYMERLFRCKPTGDEDVQRTLRQMSEQLHGYGICHNDLREPNLMQDATSALVLIDFGRSGFIGQPIPIDLEDKHAIEAANRSFVIRANVEAVSCAFD